MSLLHRHHTSNFSPKRVVLTTVWSCFCLLFMRLYCLALPSNHKREYYLYKSAFAECGPQKSTKLKLKHFLILSQPHHVNPFVADTTITLNIESQHINIQPECPAHPHHHQMVSVPENTNQTRHQTMNNLIYSYRSKIMFFFEL